MFTAGTTTGSVSCSTEERGGVGGRGINSGEGFGIVPEALDCGFVLADILKERTEEYKDEDVSDGSECVSSGEFLLTSTTQGGGCDEMIL